MGDDCSLFHFEHVGVRFGATTVLDGVDVSVPDGGVIVLAGPSGSGKSTMLRLCNRLTMPSDGRVHFRGADVATLDPLALRRGVGMVFQRPTLFDGTVLENLRVARPELARADAADALERVGLDGDMLDRAGRDLSGGEAQRACLARTMATEPSVLLMDEPTAMLDLDSSLVLERLVRGLVSADGLAVIWVSHDSRQIERMADWVVRVEAGRVVASEPSRPTGDGAS